MSQTKLQLACFGAAFFVAALFADGASLTSFMTRTAGTNVPAHLANIAEAAGASGLMLAGQQVTMLKERDAKLYRSLFDIARGGEGDFDKVADLIVDKRLVSTAKAESLRFLGKKASYQAIASWLKDHGKEPQARNVYALAQKTGQPVAKPAMQGPIPASLRLTEPGMRARIEIKDTFTAHETAMAKKLNQSLSKARPSGAHADLIVVNKGKVSSAWMDEAFAAVAAGYYFDGNLPQAQSMLSVRGGKTALGRWIDGLSQWRERDYRKSLASFAALADQKSATDSDRAAAAFWGFRAAIKLDQKQQAQQLLAKAAKLQPKGFYGLMAKRILRNKQQGHWKLPQLTQHNLETLSNMPGGWRALALLQIGEREAAEFELRHIHPGNDEHARRALLHLAQAAQLPGLTLQMGGLMRDNSLAVSYPVPPWRPLNGFSVDRALVYAIVRQESRFNPRAGSGSGAKGLMQLMPEAVEQITGAQLPVDHLYDPATNLTLGESYLLHLTKQTAFKGNLIGILAAYNAGPTRVQRWLKEPDFTKDPLLFVESIPLRETRDYVEHVLAGSWVYADRLNRPAKSLLELATAKWPAMAMEPAAVRTASADLTMVSR